MKRVALYVRVSTDDQNVQNQIDVLHDVAKQRGWTVIEIYKDEGISGAKGKDRRPGFRKLCSDATNGKFDMIAAWSVDRLSRSLQDLVMFFNDMSALNVGLYLHQQSVDSSTPSGMAMLQMSAVFAQFERSMLMERIHAGIARARRAGKVFGRPRVSSSVEQLIRRHRANGVPIRKCAKLCGVGVSVVQRVARS